jgi:hypothetical protein
MSGTYSGVQSDLTVYLKDDCPTVLSANTRRLTRVLLRFEELGVHSVLIKFSKD